MLTFIHNIIASIGLCLGIFVKREVPSNYIDVELNPVIKRVFRFMLLVIAAVVAVYLFVLCQTIMGKILAGLLFAYAISFAIGVLSLIYSFSLSRRMAN